MTAHRPTPPEADSNGAADQYLWDGTGEVDPLVARLERTLEPLRYRHAPIDERRRVTAHVRQASWFRAAALLALSMAGIASMSLFSTSLNDVFTIKRQRNERSDGGWNVVTLQGAPRVGEIAVTGHGVLRVGDWIETDAQSRAEIEVGSLGQVTVEPGSRLQLMETHDREHRLHLAHGAIDAFISAPPRLFFVDTAAATAVDLGCAYTLTVDDGGAGVLEVTLGWVSFERPGASGEGASIGRESVVPRGAVCHTRPGVGPGTPFYRDAPEALKRALDELDFAAGGPAALQTLLHAARDRDSLTLWHLLAKLSNADDRALVFDRLSSIWPPPPQVTRDEVLKGDKPALEAWRNTFGWAPPR